MVLNWKCPKVVEKAVFSCKEGDKGVFQKPFGQIDSAQALRWSQPFELVHPWHWVGVEFCDGTDFPEVDSEPNHSIWFGNENYGAPPFTSGFYNISPISSITCTSSQIVSHIFCGNGLGFSRTIWPGVVSR